MSNDGLVSTHPYDDYALANRHGIFLLAAQVARANTLGADMVSEPALKAIRRFAAAGFTDEAWKIAQIFSAELGEHCSLKEILCATEGCEEEDDFRDRPTDPFIRIPQGPDDRDYLPPTLFPPAGPAEDIDVSVYHVLPFPNVPDEEPVDVSADVVLLDDFDNDRDTLVDGIPPFAADDQDVEGRPDASDPSAD